MIALMLLLPAAAASAAPGDRERARREREARAHPEYYGCVFTRSVASGQLVIGAQVDPDGHPTSYTFRWDGGASGEGLSTSYEWSGTSYGPVEWWHATFTLATRQHLGFATLVLRDSAGRIIYEPRFGGSYGGRSPGSSLRYYSLDLSVEMFAQVLGTPGGAVLELRGRRTLPAVPIDTAPIAIIQAALAADRGEIERRIADYRNRCEPGRNEEIVVT